MLLGACLGTEPEIVEDAHVHDLTVLWSGAATDSIAVSVRYGLANGCYRAAGVIEERLNPGSIVLHARSARPADERIGCYQVYGYVTDTVVLAPPFPGDVAITASVPEDGSVGVILVLGGLPGPPNTRMNGSSAAGW